MKILYFGGQKSGKSLLAEKKALSLSKKPIYLATYDNSWNDKEMEDRISFHKQRRKDNFETLEESRDLSKVLKENQTYLIDCIGTWILNTLVWERNRVLEEIEKIKKVDSNIIFVLNEVGSGVIPIDNISREFVDRVGIVGQKLVSFCDEVYEVKFGLQKRLK